MTIIFFARVQGSYREFERIIIKAKVEQMKLERTNEKKFIFISCENVLRVSGTYFLFFLSLPHTLLRISMLLLFFLIFFVLKLFFVSKSLAKVLYRAKLLSFFSSTIFIHCLIRTVQHPALQIS